MARRRQSNRDSGLELCVKLGLLFVVLIILAVGPARWGALMAMGTTVILVLLGLGALALLGWLAFRFLLPCLKRKFEPGVRILHYPQQTGDRETWSAPPNRPTEPKAEAKTEPPQREPSPCPAEQAATEPQPEPRVATGDLTGQFRALDWFQFEKIVGLIYRKLGNDVERRGGANADGGIDLLLRRNGTTLGVQCKHWKTWKVGVKSVREFLGALTTAGLQEGVFVSLGEFTPDAASLASRHGIRMVDARDLAELVDRAGVRSDPEFLRALTNPIKYCPKCERELVLRTAAKGANAGQQFWGCSTYPRCKYILRT